MKKSLCFLIRGVNKLQRAVKVGLDILVHKDDNSVWHYIATVLGVR